jgi:hypothetical protein
MSTLHTRVVASVAALACVGLALPASSASVETMRVGQHPSFTRVVFELDRTAGYRLERRLDESGAGSIVVTLDASLAASTPRLLRSGSSLLESVSVEQPRDRAVATIQLRHSNLPVKEMILSNPPRIVLDVLGQDANLGAARVAKAKARKPARKPAPTPAPEVEPEPKAAAAVPARPPAEARPVEPKEAPLRVAEAPEPEAVRPKPAKEMAEPAKPKAEPAEAAQRIPTPGQAKAPEAAPARDFEAERAAREAMQRRLAAVREAAEKRKRQVEERKAKAPSPSVPPEPQEAEASAEVEGGLPWLSIGAVAVVAAVALAGVVVLRRRRRIPRDFDFKLFGPEVGEPPSSDRETVAEPFAADEAAAGAQEGLTPPLSAPGLFDELEKGDIAMEPHVQDMAMDQTAAVGAPASSELGRVIAELERRVEQLESRLQESNSARERLERQVAAQSEELRVQRAAIARTQRALRGLTRSEEEQATEPALRE